MRFYRINTNSQLPVGQQECKLSNQKGIEMTTVTQEYSYDLELPIGTFMSVFSICV